MNSRELLKEADKLNDQIEKSSWIGGTCLFITLGVPLFGIVLLMAAGVIFGFNVDKYAWYFILFIPVGGITGLILAIHMSGVQRQRDMFRKQAIKQWGSDEEEY